MTHLAIWESPGEDQGPETEWGALVTDDEYRYGPLRAHAGLVLSLSGQQPRAAARLEVEHGPQFGKDVQPVKAQIEGLSLGNPEPCGQVPVSRPVDLLHPGPQPGNRLAVFCGGELPPHRCRSGAIAVRIFVD